MPELLKILIVDDEVIVLDTLGGYLRESGHDVVCSQDATTALELMNTGDFDVAIVDIRLPRMDGMSLLAKMQHLDRDLPVVIITGHGNMETVIQALRQGAADFLTKPVHLIDLDAVLERTTRVRRLRQDCTRLRSTIGGLQSSEWERHGEQIMIGESAATKRSRDYIQQAVDANCDTVLITGETGTGKEVAAREFHLRRHSRDDAFIAVSCPAIPDSLVESELFGHVRGAFTGATVNRAGCFELADGGTLFLDEIGDLTPQAQAKLLRVLETRVVRRVGSARETPVNVHVVAATNAPLATRVQEKRFRSDLYYRLNVFSIHLQPLRERREDIMPLANHFLQTFCRPRQKQINGFTARATSLLVEYDYPGNARELRNIIERAAILTAEARIDIDHLHLRDMPSNEGAGAAPDVPIGADLEREQLLAALGQVKWNRSQAAKLLGMPYSTFRYKMKKHDLG